MVPDDESKIKGFFELKDGIMADFKEVFDRATTEAKLTIELQKSGKNKGAIKVKTASGTDGADVLHHLLRAYGWDKSYEEFLGEAQKHLTPKSASTKKEKSSTQLKACVIEHPDISDRRVYVRNDLALLKPIRFVVQDNCGSGRIVLAHTGEPGSTSGDTYALVSTASQGSGVGFTSSLRSSLASIPATKEWQEDQIDKAIQEKKVIIYADLDKRNKEADEPLPLEELEEMALRTAEESRDEIAKDISKSTMLMQCNDGLKRLLEMCSNNIRGQEKAHDVFVNAMRGPNFPLLFCRSSKLRAWYNVESTQLSDGTTITKTYAERFDYDGDYVDLIAENLEYLWGVPQLCIPMPKIFTNDPTVPCFHFYDLESVKSVEGQYPAWDEFLTRFSEEEADVFKAFVWSIFDAENRGRQCLYLIDKGYSGKSAVINAIANAIGSELHVALSKDSLSNQFAFSKIWDKRFVTIGDNKNPNLVRSQAMHSMLGGDIVDVEYKGRDPFPSRLQCKVFVASNVHLNIDVKARNEYTRVLPIHPDDSDEALIARGIAALDEDGNPRRTSDGNIIVVGDPTWEGRLIDEFRAFLSSCYPVYQRMCPKRMDIIIPERSAEILATFDDDRAALLEEILDRHFEITKDETDFIERARMQRAFVEAQKDDDTYKEARLTFAEWKEFLRRRYNLDASRPRSIGHKWGYMGIRLKSATDNDSSLV